MKNHNHECVFAHTLVILQWKLFLPIIPTDSGPPVVEEPLKDLELIFQQPVLEPAVLEGNLQRNIVEDLTASDVLQGIML